MFLKIGIGLVAVLIVFMGYVSTKDGHFRYERSGVINAPAEKIFPYLSNLKLGSEWSPYDKKDSNLKRTFIGTDGEVGSIMEFEGDSSTGSGKIEMLKIVPNSIAEYRLTMIKPFHAENLIEYKLTPEGSGTRFTWSMSGDGGFLGKLIGTLIDCEKMVTGDFEKGIASLKQVVESRN